MGVQEWVYRMGTCICTHNGHVGIDVYKSISVGI